MWVVGGKEIDSSRLGGWQQEAGGLQDCLSALRRAAAKSRSSLVTICSEPRVSDAASIDAGCARAVWLFERGDRNKWVRMEEV